MDQRTGVEQEMLKEGTSGLQRRMPSLLSPIRRVRSLRMSGHGVTVRIVRTGLIS